MNLPDISSFLPKRKESQPHHYFLALQIGKSVSKAAVWEQRQDIIIKKIAQAQTPAEAIEKAIIEFDPVTQVTFGLPHDYVLDNKIKESHLPELKRIAHEANLTPIGFVVISEAIAHQLEKETNAPQTTIFLGIEELKLTFSLFRIGKLIKIIDIPRSEQLLKDMETGLAAFDTEEILPSKIILYDGTSSLEDLKEQLLSYPWQKNEKFLHVPKIEILPWEFSIKAIVYAGVTDTQEETNAAFSKTDQAAAPPEDTASSTVVTPDEMIEEDDSNSPNLGFVVNKDIRESEPILSTTQPVHADTPVKKTFKMPSVKLPALSLPHSLTLPMPKGILPIIVTCLIFAAVVASSVYIYPQATVALIAEPNIVDNEVSMTLSTSISDVNLDKKQVPGKVYSVTVNGETATETSGKKTIGEKASGDVLVYNKTSQPKTLKKGTVLSASSSVVFTLENDVTVASASDTGESLAYGKEKVKVLAAKIGPAGNIKKDTEFAVDDTTKSSVVAKNEVDFSGGTEREIAIASKEDQEKLVKKLTDTLKEEARQKLQSQIGGGDQFLDESLKANIIEKKFDKETGEETDNISLGLTVEYSQVGYKEDDLNKFLEQYMKKQITDQYDFDSSKSYFNVKEAKQAEDGSITFTANYHAYLLPKIDVSPFAKAFAGKSKGDVEKLVSEMKESKIVGYDLRFKRQLPLFKNQLPLNPKNIEVKVIPY